MSIGWAQGGLGLDHEPASERTMTKCAWRVACEARQRNIRSVEKLIAVTANIRRAFHLDESEHRQVCETALLNKESDLSLLVYAEDIHARS